MPVTITLSEPVEFGQKTITELTLQEPKAKHLRKINLPPTMDDLLNIASKLAGEAPAVIDELAARDALRVAEVIGGFLEPTPATGRTA